MNSKIAKLDSSNKNTRQFLTFSLAGEGYGIDILNIQEIKGWESMRDMPDTPDFVCGIINVRGSLVPVIDLRIRFSIKDHVYDESTVIIIVHWKDESKKRIVGYVVDSVSDVISIPNDELLPAPKIGGTIRSDLLEGVSLLDDKMFFILDLNGLVSVTLLADMELQVT